MADPAATRPTAPTTCAQLPCPLCGEASANLTLDLSDTAGDEAFHCRECDGNFSRGDIDTLIRKWSRLLVWVDALPDLDAE